MHTSPLKRWLVAITLLAVLLFAAFLWLRPLLSIGGGYAAKHACSCHFLQGRDLEEISEHDLNFSVLGQFSLAVSSGKVPDYYKQDFSEEITSPVSEILPQRITSSFYGVVQRTAVYRRGYGCTLINDEDYPEPGAVEEWTADPPLSLMPRGDFSRERMAPSVRSLPLSLNQRLDTALDYGMQPVPGGGARGIVILKNGRIVGERYAEGYDADTPLLGWSMTKTLTALLAGHVLFASRIPQAQDTPLVSRIPQAQDTPLVGRIPQAAPEVRPPSKINHLFPTHWTDRRAEITLADLLHMNSGLAWNEGYGSLTDATVMLHERPDFADFATRSQFIEEPGTVWNYSSGTTNIVMEYLSRQVGGNDRLIEKIDSLFSPIAPSLLIEPDQSGRPVGSSYGWATARDWARLGQFMLQDGIWEGDTLLPTGWIDWMREPAAGSDGNYGGHLWLPDEDMPSLPEDAYMMRGFQDQRVFVIPSLDLVIARLGHGEDKATDFDGLILRIIDSYD